MKMKKTIAAVVAILIIATGAFIIHTAYAKKEAATNDAPVVFAQNRMLLELWSTYKTQVLEPGSLRAIDKSSSQNITTSEGQSYTMMRAAWMDDMDTFNTTWTWTKNNMQRTDGLVSWKFGEISKNHYGILTDEGGQNTASDADTDTAFALLMAAGRWKEPSYKWDAIKIIQSIWDEEVVVINGKPVLAANDIERNNLESIIVNPSYFSPAAYRAFAKVDPTHDWNGLIDSSYSILAQASAAKLDKSSSDGLTPNWIRINRTTGAIMVAPEYNSDYSYDAMRTPFRMALDWEWNKDPRAKQILLSESFLGTQYEKTGSLKTDYTHDGLAAVTYGSPAMNGTSMAYFDVIRPDLASAYYTKELVQYYDPDTQSWKHTMSYYDDNWVWFGMALHNKQLPDLTELIHV